MIKKYLNSTFLKSAALLTSATTLGQIITLITAPVLARIYSPTNYDVLGIFMMVTGLVGVFATLQYHNVIITAKEDEEANDAIALCISLSLIVSVIVLVLVLLLYGFLDKIFKSEAISVWLLFAPVSVFASGLTTALSAWANRKEFYKSLSASRVMSAVLVPIFSISIGLIIGGPLGLIIGLLISQIIPAIYLLKAFFKGNTLGLSFNKNKLLALSKKHSSYVKYSMPSEFVNNFVNQLPTIYFASSFGLVGVVGNFNLSNRLLAMPIQLISTSISEVFRQRASKDYNAQGECTRVFTKTFKTLLLVSIVPFTILMLTAPWLFQFVFGEKWIMAGHFSQILAPMFMLKFIVSPLTYMFFIANKQKQDFVGHILMVLLVAIAFLLAKIFTTDYFITLMAYSTAYSLIYLVYLYFSYKYSKGE